jgi:hypothetical protein
MKTVVNVNGEKMVVAENASEAMEMFRKALARRKRAIADDGDDRSFYNREESSFKSFKSNKNFYDYGLE